MFKFKSKEQKIKEQHILYIFAKNSQRHNDISEDDIKEVFEICFEGDLIPQKNFYYADVILRDNLDLADDVDPVKTGFYKLLKKHLETKKYFSYELSPKEKSKIYDEELKVVNDCYETAKEAFNKSEEKTTDELKEKKTIKQKEEDNEVEEIHTTEEPKQESEEKSFVKNLGDLITKISGVNKDDIAKILEGEEITFEENACTFNKDGIQYGIMFANDVVKNLAINGKMDSINTMKDCDILTVLPAAEGSKVKSGKDNNNGYEYLYGDNTVIAIGVNPETHEIFVSVEYNAPRNTRRKFTTSASKKK